MKYALINGEKAQAVKGLAGECQGCGATLIAKCGDIKIHHWAHKGKRICDPWWENETEWHRAWKNNFKAEWQEVIHFSESGEKHIADVKTPNGWVLELQHSFLNQHERLSRIQFYKKLVWVVDGTRRVRDKTQFMELLNGEFITHQKPTVLEVRRLNDCRIVQEWSGAPYVVFDFQVGVDEPQEPLWFMFRRNDILRAYLCPISREEFVKIFLTDNFETTLSCFFTQFLDAVKAKQQALLQRKAVALPGFENYLRIARRRRPRL
jgi:competence protein CoiA